MGYLRMISVKEAKKSLTKGTNNPSVDVFVRKNISKKVPFFAFLCASKLRKQRGKVVTFSLQNAWLFM